MCLPVRRSDVIRASDEPETNRAWNVEQEMACVNVRSIGGTCEEDMLLRQCVVGDERENRIEEILFLFARHKLKATRVSIKIGGR